MKYGAGTQGLVDGPLRRGLHGRFCRVLSRASIIADEIGYVFDDRSIRYDTGVDQNTVLNLQAGSVRQSVFRKRSKIPGNGIRHRIKSRRYRIAHAVDTGSDEYRQKRGRNKNGICRQNVGQDCALTIIQQTGTTDGERKLYLLAGFNHRHIGSFYQRHLLGACFECTAQKRQTE